MSLQNDLDDRQFKQDSAYSNTKFESNEFNAPFSQKTGPIQLDEAESDGGKKIMRRVLFGSFVVMFVMYLSGVSFISTGNSPVTEIVAPPAPPATISETAQAELAEQITQRLTESGVVNSEEIAVAVERALQEAEIALREAEVQRSVIEQFADGFRDGVSSARYSDELLQGMGDWMAEMGYGELSRQELIQLRDKGVTATYTNGLRELGYDLTLDEVVRLSQADVSVRFAAMMQSLGYKLDIDDLIRLERAGVTAFYTSNLHDLGYRDITLDQLVRFQQVGVSTNDIKKLMAQAGGERPAIEEVIRYKISNQ